jgi:4-hydroxybenzoate polyprenyltransferase
LGVRFAYGTALNLFIYLMNDCFDVRLDLEAPGRHAARTRYLQEHRGAGWAAVAVLGTILLGTGLLLERELWVAFAGSAVLTAAYSGALKRVPLLDLAVVGGICLALCLLGFRWESAAGWRLAGLAAILCLVTQTVQVLRDHDSDSRAGIRTTAVALGPAATAWLARALVLSAAAYACLFLDRWVGLLLLPALLVRPRPDTAVRSWDLLRIVFGLSWLALVAAYRIRGGLHGWIDCAS